MSDSATTATKTLRHLIDEPPHEAIGGVPPIASRPGARQSRAPISLAPSCPRHGHDGMITFPGLAGKPTALGRRPGVRPDARAPASTSHPPAVAEVSQAL